MKKLCRALFSRYAIFGVVFLAELVFLALILSYASSYSYVFLIVAWLINVLTIIGIVSRDVNPEFKVTWIAALALLPFVGALLYGIFYSRKMTRTEAKALRRINEELKNPDRSSTDEELSSLAAADMSSAGRAFALLHDDYLAELYRGSRVKYFPGGKQFYEALLTDLKSAKSYIFLEYFIIDEGKMWQGVYDIIKEKAAAGVDVRVIYDDFGCIRTLPKGFAHMLQKDGISCRCFGRLTPRLVANHNNRDHRKIAVIDGRVAYTGGINIADEYINEALRFGHWKDGGVRVSGSCTRGFTRLFLSNYYFTDLKSAELDISEDKVLGGLNDTKYSEESDGGYHIPFGDGPAPISPEYTSKNAIMNIINRAENYLYITTPYLIIDYDLTEALKSATVRGVDVRIITPGIPDKKIVKIMTKSAYPTLIASGVRIFEYAPGFIHEKLIVSDDVNAIVGTVNLDYRSLVHHFENALWIYGSSEIPVMRDEILKTLSSCREINAKEARLKPHEKAIRAVVRLIAPLL